MSQAGSIIVRSALTIVGGISMYVVGQVLIIVPAGRSEVLRIRLDVNLPVKRIRQERRPTARPTDPYGPYGRRI